MSELITWLRAQIDADERPHTGVHRCAWGDYTGFDDEKCERALEVAAKRALIERGDTLFCECDQGDSPPADPETGWTVELPHHFDCTAYRIAQVLAQPYAGREGFRDEWRVE